DLRVQRVDQLAGAAGRRAGLEPEGGARAGHSERVEIAVAGQRGEVTAVRDRDAQPRTDDGGGPRDRVETVEGGVRDVGGGVHRVVGRVHHQAHDHAAHAGDRGLQRRGTRGRVYLVEPVVAVHRPEDAGVVERHVHDVEQTTQRTDEGVLSGGLVDR